MKKLLLALLLVSSAQAADPVQHPGWGFKEAGMIPMQVGGRLKPLDSWARDISLFMLGSHSFQGWKPVDIVFSWISDPHPWVDQPFIKVGREDVRRQLVLDEKRMMYSPDELMKNPNLVQYAERMGPPPQGMKMHPREQELRRIVDRIGTFRAIAAGEAWSLIPQPGDAQWKSLAVDAPEGAEIRAAFVELVKAYKAGDQSGFDQAAARAKAAVEAKIPDWGPKIERKLKVEGFYNGLMPFRYAWVLYLLGGLLFVAAFFRGRNRMLMGGGYTLLGCALALHIGGIAMRVYIAGRPPVSNMYESVIWVSFGAVMFSAILFFLHRQVIALTVACFVAAVALIAADSAPAIMDPSIQPLVPVLNSNYWLMIHVLTITLGYAAFALSLGLADVTLYHFLKPGKDAKAVIASMNQLTYRALQFGVVLIAAGTILGGVWADYSWGRFWGWDPKEVWALIVLLCYLVILHGRYANWVGQFGFAAWTVVSFLSVLMAWYGVNFVLGAGLHSYGWSTGGYGWVVSFTLLQLGYVAICALRAKGPQFRRRTQSA